MPRSVRTSRSRTVVRCVAVLLATSSVASCSLPEPGPEEPTVDPSEEPIASSTPDPARDALVAEVRRLGSTVAGAREALAGALEAEDPTSAARAARDALALLVVDGSASTDPEDVRPLFPAESLGRDETTDAPDQLTNIVTAARDVGGPLGSAVLDLLRDPVAGDLGAWQRDAAGVLASISDTTQEATGLRGLEAAIAELPGLGTQAVAWVELTAAATTGEDARAYAERGVASLDVLLISIDHLELGTSSSDDDGAAEEAAS